MLRWSGCCAQDERVNGPIPNSGVLFPLMLINACWVLIVPIPFPRLLCPCAWDRWEMSFLCGGMEGNKAGLRWGLRSGDKVVYPRRLSSQNGDTDVCQWCEWLRQMKTIPALCHRLNKQQVVPETLRCRPQRILAPTWHHRRDRLLRPFSPHSPFSGRIDSCVQRVWTVNKCAGEGWIYRKGRVEGTY